MEPNNDPFIKALQAGASAEVARLLDEGRTVVERFHFGWTPLHLAARAGSFECTTLLLGNGAELEAKDQTGHTPLIYALNSGHAEVAAYLIRQGALLHYHFKPEDTPAIRRKLQSEYSESNAEARKAHPEAYRVIEEALPEVDQKAFEQKMVESFVATALAAREVHVVHHCANLETLQLLAQQPGTRWNIDDGGGYWPLKNFVEQGDAPSVEWLLRNGADPNFNSTGATALHTAVSRDHVECARLLLQAGANVNQPDVDGSVPLCGVASDAMLDLLLAHGADPGIGDQCNFMPSHWIKDARLKKRVLQLQKGNRRG